MAIELQYISSRMTPNVGQERLNSMRQNTSRNCKIFGACSQMNNHFNIFKTDILFNQHATLVFDMVQISHKNVSSGVLTWPAGGFLCILLDFQVKTLVPVFDRPATFYTFSAHIVKRIFQTFSCIQTNNCFAKQNHIVHM